MDELNEDIERQILDLVECVVNEQKIEIHWSEFEDSFKCEVGPIGAKELLDNILDMFHSMDNPTYSSYFSILHDILGDEVEVKDE